MSTIDPDPRTPGLAVMPTASAAPPATDLVMPQLRVIDLDQLAVLTNPADRDTFLLGVIAARAMHRYAEVAKQAPVEFNALVVAARNLPAATTLQRLLMAGPLAPSVSAAPAANPASLTQAMTRSLGWYNFLQGRFSGLVLMPGSALNLQQQQNTQQAPSGQAIRMVLTGDAKCRIAWLHAGRPTYVQIRAPGNPAINGPGMILGFRMSFSQPAGVAQSLLPIARAAGSRSSAGGNFPLDYLVRQQGQVATAWVSHQNLFGTVTEEYGYLTPNEAAAPTQWQGALP